MDKQDTSNMTVYADLLTVLKNKGFTDAEIAEIFMKFTAQVELEVTEEMMERLTPEQQSALKNLPSDATGEDVVEKLGLDGDEINEIRAKKVAELIEKMIPYLNKEDLVS
ncbi:MAG: hypothetical protein C4584_00500 [Armatimonadetes bacterium]|nr:MAG: hypothetical protein C4584_00500 [Armatimonadota bacterium]